MLKSNKRARKPAAAHGNFNHPLYPRADDERSDHSGEPPRPTQVRRQFLDAYFRINLAYAKLVALRARWRSRPPKAAETALLRKIEEALVAREALENRHACRGFIAAPIYRDGYAVQLLFSDSHAGLERGRVLVASSSCVRLNIALPDGVRSELCKS